MSERAVSKVAIRLGVAGIIGFTALDCAFTRIKNGCDTIIYNSGKGSYETDIHAVDSCTNTNINLVDSSSTQIAEIASTSYDGRYFGYMSNKDGIMATYLYNVATGTSQTVSSPGTLSSDIKFSPTDDRFLYSEYAGGNNLWNIIISDTNRENTRTLATNSDALGWSPKGQYILFAHKSENGDVSDLDIYDTYTDNVRKLPDYLINGMWFNWSKEEDALIFFMNDQIFRFNLKDESLINITNDDSRNIHPVLSSDGKQIAFISNRNGDSQLFTIDVDGTNVHQVTNIPPGTIISEYTWSPDSSQLYYFSFVDPNPYQGELTAINIQNGQNRVISTNLRIGQLLILKND